MMSMQMVNWINWILCKMNNLLLAWGGVLVAVLVEVLVVGLTPLKLKPLGSRVHSVVRRRLKLYQACRSICNLSNRSPCPPRALIQFHRVSSPSISDLTRYLQALAKPATKGDPILHKYYRNSAAVVLCYKGS